MQLETFFEDVLTVRPTASWDALDIIDQTLLPGKISRITLKTKEEIWEAIKKLRVRGAPAIGVCAALGLAMLAKKISAEGYDSFYAELKSIKDYLASSRPTAVNLFWALNRMDEKAKSMSGKNVSEVKEALVKEALNIQQEDIQISRNIGEYGFGLMKKLKKEGKELGILTHCNAGTLATAKYGTALAPIYVALEHGWSGQDIHMYCDETRPLLQGARLTAFELSKAGVKTTLQCDNMASMLMKQGKIDMIFVGADRIAANGDTANKIGTSSVAILAKHYGIPFFVCAPTSTLDPSAKTGADIPIEMRASEEVSKMWYENRMAPEGNDIFNPAFDYAEHELITGIITEKGIATAPFDQAFERLGI
ncbi:MAG: S-methyl-5-thioribose-1-phosphate isomerase [Lachnospiraceae bacterium]|nr:S-methyl-5-thioribose-1-phosphate isomerase [Lachnospiraceae bacterium]